MHPHHTPSANDRPRRGLALAALLGASLFVAACQSESLTAVATEDGSSTPPVAFPVASGAADAVRSSSRRIVRTLATLQLRGNLRGDVSGAGTVTNSPWDLTYGGGPLVTHATSWNVYVNCASTPASCWGTGSLTPATFLRDLNHSNIIQVADQYVGKHAYGQFSVAELSTTATFTNNVASIDDILGIIYSASTFANANGYTNIIHVFLPQGTDMCIDATDCYSPDNFDTSVFCAFHGGVDFSPTQHVLFSVEPYQAVDGCAIPGQTPHGVIDATASTLSHEFFETISDPDLDSWFNFLTGNEMADLCFAFGNNERMGSHAYVIQSEYSNAIHACTDGV